MTGIRRNGSGHLRFSETVQDLSFRSPGPDSRELLNILMRGCMKDVL